MEKEYYTYLEIFLALRKEYFIQKEKDNKIIKQEIKTTEKPYYSLKIDNSKIVFAPYNNYMTTILYLNSQDLLTFYNKLSLSKEKIENLFNIKISKQLLNTYYQNIIENEIIKNIFFEELRTDPIQTFNIIEEPDNYILKRKNNF